jgi:hypothetical protein
MFKMAKVNQKGVRYQHGKQERTKARNQEAAEKENQIARVGHRPQLLDGLASSRST